MRSDSSDLLTLAQAAQSAGMSVQAFRVYVASGNIKPEQADSQSPMFRRDAVARVAEMQRNAVAEVREAAIEKLAAELVVMREAVGRQAEIAEGLAALQQVVKAQESALDGLGEAVSELRTRTDADRKRIDAGEAAAAKLRTALESVTGRLETQVKQAAEQEKLIAGATADFRKTDGKVDELGEIVLRAHQASTVSAGALEEHNKLLAEHAAIVDELRADQRESRRRINHLLDKLADAFGQVRASESAPAEPESHASAKGDEPKAQGKSKSAATQEREPAPLAEPKAKAAPAPALSAAKFGVIREIEFNYLIERMGYQRLDEYEPEALVVSDEIAVPDEDTIREFLAKYELGCSVAEVEIAAITRGNWQMIQYQRVPLKAGKRAWITAKH